MGMINSPTVSWASVARGVSPEPTAPLTPPPPASPTSPAQPTVASADVTTTTTTTTTAAATNSPPSSLPDSQTTASWAHTGRVAWLDRGMIAPSSIIRQRLMSEERVRGFENHPVLIWEAPDENGIVTIIPITSYGGQRAEVKWARMANAKKRWTKLQMLLLLENGAEKAHADTHLLLFTEQYKCRKRSYLNIEHGCYKIEVDSLTPYTHGSRTELTLCPLAIEYTAWQLRQFVNPSFWVSEKPQVCEQAQVVGETPVSTEVQVVAETQASTEIQVSTI